MSNNIGYHTRMVNDPNVKVVGGSFPGKIDQATVERLSRNFTVRVTPSGSPVFVDDRGRAVRLYLSIDPESTAVGKLAMAKHKMLCRIEEERQKAEDAANQKEINELMGGLTREEIIRRLRGL